MMHHSRIVLTLSIAAALSIAACSDSTGPSAVHLAQHFDSLYSAAVADGSIGNRLRAEIVTELEIPSAFGAIPRDVNVTTANGVEHWKGFEYAINPEGSEFENNNILVLYRDANAHTVLIAGFAQDGSMNSVFLLANDTVGSISSDFSGNSALTSSSENCPAPPQHLANPGLVSYEFGTCTLATFSTSASATFVIGPDVDPALGQLAIGTTEFHGEVFVSGFQTWGRASLARFRIRPERLRSQ